MNSLHFSSVGTAFNAISILIPKISETEGLLNELKNLILLYIEYCNISHRSPTFQDL